MGVLGAFCCAEGVWFGCSGALKPTVGVTVGAAGAAVNFRTHTKSCKHRSINTEISGSRIQSSPLTPYEIVKIVVAPFEFLQGRGVSINAHPVRETNRFGYRVQKIQF